MSTEIASKESGFIKEGSPLYAVEFNEICHVDIEVGKAFVANRTVVVSVEALNPSGMFPEAKICFQVRPGKKERPAIFVGKRIQIENKTVERIPPDIKPYCHPLACNLHPGEKIYVGPLMTIELEEVKSGSKILPLGIKAHGFPVINEIDRQPSTELWSKYVDYGRYSYLDVIRSKIW